MRMSDIRYGKEFQSTEDHLPKVLIVDDRVENLVVLEKLLSGLNVEPVRATSGNQALSLSLEHEFALALVDVQMPDMDGYETVKLLHEQQETLLLPVIFVSAIYSGEYYKVKGVEVGAIDFIEKPIVPELLLGKVKIFLELYQYQRLQKSIKQKLQQNISDISNKLEESYQQLAEVEKQHKKTQEALNDVMEDLKDAEELKRMVNLMTGREVRMAELKQEIKRLNSELDKLQG